MLLGLRNNLNSRCAGRVLLLVGALGLSVGGAQSQQAPAIDPAPPAQEHEGFTETRGTLPARGTEYAIWMPDDWNGVLISDLDFASASNVDLDRAMHWVTEGYAISGTQRRADRGTNYDPAREIHDLISVIDIFASEHGQPERVLYYGESGGGHDGLAISEMSGARYDGAVSACAHTPVWLMNSELDTWFTLQALIAPELTIVNMPEVADYEGLGQAWSDALTAAQETPEGRARIALAVALGQMPAWVGISEEPDYTDAAALQQAMFETMVRKAQIPGGQSRAMFENAAQSQPSWNTDVDYAAFYENAPEDYRNAVEQLYEEAGLDLQADLRTVNDAPRVEADPEALDFWSQPGRTIFGTPRIPVMRIHTNGDPSVNISLVQGYTEQVEANGFSHLYRTASINADGHCNFTVGESAAALNAVEQYLDTGNWPDTGPSAMNALAESLVPEGDSHYYDLELTEYNRTWFPEPSSY